jgi:hypothetical protein
MYFLNIANYGKCINSLKIYVLIHIFFVHLKEYHKTKSFFVFKMGTPIYRNNYYLVYFSRIFDVAVKIWTNFFGINHI